MSDQRPRPQYGEYASLDDQARAMGVDPKAHAKAAAEATAEAEARAKRRAAEEAAEAKAAAQAESAAGSTAARNSAVHDSAPRNSTPANTERMPPSATGLGAYGAQRPARTWNLMLTVTFLTLGGVSVINSFPQFLDLAAALNQAAVQLGAGKYTNLELAASIGIALNVVQVTLYLASLAVSVVLLRKKRVAFYVPLIGGVLFVVIMIVLFAVAIFGDPTFMDSLPKS